MLIEGCFRRPVALELLLKHLDHVAVRDELCRVRLLSLEGVCQHVCWDDCLADGPCRSLQSQLLFLNQLRDDLLINLLLILLESKVEQHPGATAVVKEHEAQEGLLTIFVEELDVTGETVSGFSEVLRREVAMVKAKILLRSCHFVPIDALALPLLEFQLLDCFQLFDWVLQNPWLLIAF